MLGPMKLMMASEFASTGAPEISVFQRLSLAKGRNPLRLAPCPVLMALHALWLLPPEPEPEPLPLPDPLPDPLPPLPEPPPPDDSVEAPEDKPPPQSAQERASTSAAVTASNLFEEDFMSLFSPETAAKPHGVGPYLAEKGTCTISIWLRDQNYGGQQSLEAAQILCDTELVP